MDSTPVLNQGWGYGLMIGLGILFAVFMIIITWALKRYNSELQTSEMFTTAGRSLKSGLVASSVLSTWTWAATLLQSTAVAYKYGVSGPVWYASGATVQIILFATLAIELKRRAPNAHTFLEVVKARYGPITHGVYIVFCCFCNILVTAMLLTGGSAVIQNLTGAPVAASVFLFPIGVVVYTLFGGIKATFITDYINGLVILVIIFVFAFTVYSTNELLGSPGRVWEILTELAAKRPLSGNSGGSYLTMRSQGGAIAASPIDALPGYVMGGISWFAVPWLTATTMGLAGLALETYDVWPTYPNRFSPADVDAGLVLPTAAVALLGKGGAVATLILAFMAIMSTYSSELIAVSSICTYDIYKTYFNPSATGKQLMRINYIGMGIFALFMAGFATGLNYVGISMGYLYLMMGVIISSAVLPATLTLLWSGQSWAAATFSPIIGFVLSMTAWLVTTKIMYGELSVTNTGANGPMLAGNLTSLLSPLLFIPLLTFIPPFKPQKYDWQSMLNIRQSDDRDFADGASMDIETAPTVQIQALGGPDEKAKLDKAAKTARWLTVGVTLVLLILWPMPLYGSGYVFGKSFFTGWVVVGITWLFASMIMVVFLPIFESRSTIVRTSQMMLKDLFGIKGRKKPAIDGQSPNLRTPPEVAEKVEPKA
ncbi:sodium symporter family protein [Colletotrichum graminicola]|uniref:Sodium symporter family protein n=1 Tax=Colletotrichum graminicola (strain M1.001 / M2 / FGSC 10212) TaxID=645133 RepID=E3QPK0_COLGM|nr:sodium symporter family protein [Colletotrichum graminicola M1.001]EFQ32905.1 sodium symporter family protein [Colletotrichum graminicola M1.001]WDK16568.1 sodium symporter family protein [Colletotrichum graminicola]